MVEPPRNRVHVGQVLDFAAALAPASVQALVTSPPYFGLRDYQIPPTAWPAIEYAPMPGLPPLAVPAMTCCLGLEPTPEAYTGHLVAIFRALRPSLRDDGTLWLNLGDSYWTKPHGNGSTHDPKWPGGRNRAEGGGANRHLPTGVKHKDLIGIPWRVAFALQADGWYNRTDVVWSKPNAMPSSVEDRPTRSHEAIFLLARSPRYYYDRHAIAEPLAAETAKRLGQRDLDRQMGGMKTEAYLAHHPGQKARDRRPADILRAMRDKAQLGKNRRSVWTIPTEPFPGGHFAVFPTRLARLCILASTSAAGECSACGTPWVRVVERTPMELRRSDRSEAMGEYGRTATSGTMVSLPTATTAGWRPRCACAAPARPQLVLDPFVGSGTSALVAVEEGRDWLGCDLDPRSPAWTAGRLARAQRRLQIGVA